MPLSPNAQDALKQLQLTDGSKPHSYFSLYLTALIILIGRLTGDEDICVGTSGENGKAFVLRTPYNASESFVSLLSKVEQV